MPFAGVEQTLGRLAASGLALGVATMDSEENARAGLTRLGLHRHLDFLCGADSGFGQKPQGGMVAAFSRHLGIPAREIMVVGDTPHDLRMARAGGAGWAVGVLCGTGTREALGALADHLIGDVRGVVALLEPEPGRTGSRPPSGRGL